MVFVPVVVLSIPSNPSASSFTSCQRSQRVPLGPDTFSAGLGVVGGHGVGIGLTAASDGIARPLYQVRDNPKVFGVPRCRPNSQAG